MNKARLYTYIYIYIYGRSDDIYDIINQIKKMIIKSN